MIMDKLEQLIEDYQSIQIAKHHLVRLEELLIVEKNKLAVLTQVVNKEYEDIRKFEFFMVKALFQYFLGDYESQYEIEKQEYLMAVLQYRDAKKVVDLLEFEREVIKKKMSKEAEVVKEMDFYIRRRKELFGKKYPEIKYDLINFAKEIDDKIALKKELKEALEVCVELDNVVTKIIRNLEQAVGLSTWKIDRSAKQQQASHLDVAFDLAHKVTPLFHKLESEMNDVFQHQSIYKVTMYEELRHFNDIYYDRLISDWILRRKIQSTLNTSQDAHDSVKRIAVTLQAEIKKAEHEFNYIKQRQEDIIREQLNASDPPSSDLGV